MPHIFDLGEDVLLEISAHLTAISIAYFFGCSKRLWQLRSKSPHYDQKIMVYQYFVNTQNWDEGLTFASYHGDEQEARFFINKGSNDWNWGMCAAAEGGHMKLIDFFISKGADDWNWGMKQATAGSHKHIVEFFVGKGADQWNQGMKRAIDSDDKELVEYFIDKGADDWKMAIEQSIKKGNLELVELFDYYADDVELDWLELVNISIGGGSTEIVEYCLGKTKITNWNELLHGAVITGRKDIVQLLFDKGADTVNTSMVVIAVASGDKDLVELLLKKGDNDWVPAMTEAVVQGNLEMVIFLDTSMDDNTRLNIDWNQLMCNGIGIGNQEIVDYCINKGGANNWLAALVSCMYSHKMEMFDFFASITTKPDLNRALLYATRISRLDYAERLLQKGADDVHEAFCLAAFLGDAAMVNCMMDNGANDWNRGLSGAVINKQRAFIEYFLEKGASVDFGMSTAAFHGHRDLVFFFVQKGSCDWKEGLKSAAAGGQTEIVEFFLRKGPTETDLLEAMEAARLAGHQHLTEVVLADALNSLQIHSEGNIEGAINSQDYIDSIESQQVVEEVALN